MKSLNYVKEHIDEFELDGMFDNRFTKRFLDFLPVSEWDSFGFKHIGEGEHTPLAWTEENVLAQLKRDVEFGWEKCVNERGISSELMAYVVKGWCRVLENGLDLGCDDGYYHRKQFLVVARHYGWTLEELED